jgi:N4-gp56 family major capsid protein
MALGTNHQTTTTAANFIPEIWSDETIAAYKQNLVLGNLVSKINHKGKKGDTIHIPNPARGEASAKAAETQVTLVTDTAGVINVSIDKHFEYSHLFEDISDIQALNSMRRFYTDAAGYGLAKRIDQELHALAQGFNGGAATGEAWAGSVIGGDGTTAFSDGANTNTGNGSVLTDAGIRKMIQSLDDTDTPMMGRVMVLPPVEKNNLTGIARFTEQAFVGDGNTIKNGIIGSIYGMEVYVSTNCPWLHVNDQTGNTTTTFLSASPTGASHADFYGNTEDWNTSSPVDTKYRAGMILHKDAMVLAEQLGIRTQQQYKQEYLGTLVTADTIFGTAELRDDAAVSFVIPA